VGPASSALRAGDVGIDVTYFLAWAVPCGCTPACWERAGVREPEGLPASGALCNQGTAGKGALVGLGQIQKLLLSPWRRVVRI